MKSELKAS